MSDPEKNHLVGGWKAFTGGTLLNGVSQLAIQHSAPPTSPVLLGHLWKAGTQRLHCLQPALTIPLWFANA